MVSLHTLNPQQPRVTAVFGDGAQSFSLSQGATFGELAGRIDGLEMQHQGGPFAIHITFGIPPSRPTNKTSLRHNPPT